MVASFVYLPLVFVLFFPLFSTINLLCRVNTLLQHPDWLNRAPWLPAAWTPPKTKVATIAEVLWQQAFSSYSSSSNQLCSKSVLLSSVKVTEQYKHGQFSPAFVILGRQVICLLFIFALVSLALYPLYLLYRPWSTWNPIAHFLIYWSCVNIPLKFYFSPKLVCQQLLGTWRRWGLFMLRLRTPRLGRNTKIRRWTMSGNQLAV